VLASLGAAALLIGGVVAPGSSATPAVADDQPDSRPNIVFITTDDMRVEDLRVMPNVQRLLIDRGTYFTNSYAPFPLCCPTRASWLTGQYNHNNGVMGNASAGHPEGGFAALDASNTVATWLQDAGYQTAFVGKFLNHYGLVKPVTVPPGWAEWHAALGANNYYSTALRENHTGTLVTTRYDGQYQVGLYGSIARDIMNARLPGEAPLFLWVSQFAPHSGGPVEPDDPRIANPAVPDRYRDLYAGTPLPKDPSYNEEDVSDKPAQVRSLGLIKPAMEAQLTESNQQRWESLRAVDDSVQNIVRTLRDNGELANTILVFSSDNGYMFGEHRIHAGKTVAYEPSARVPLVIRGPGFPAGESRRAAVATIDLAPTFADAAGTTPGLTVDGRSLLPLADSPSTWPDRTLVLEAGPTVVGGDDIYHGIRTPQYKYIRHSTGEVEFYDLDNDPNEMQSLTDDPEYDVVQELLGAELRRLEDCSGRECR
jgi:N-acetylglucosamine-6-sulfatase